MKKARMVTKMKRDHQCETKSLVNVAQLRRGAQRAILKGDVSLEAEMKNSKRTRYLTLFRQKRHENV